jgi:hypothetical protein
MHISDWLWTYVIYGAFTETRKVRVAFRISLRFSACINSAPIRPISMKFNIRVFHLESVEKV